MTKTMGGLPRYNLSSTFFEGASSIESIYSPLPPNKEIKCTVQPHVHHFVFMIHGNGALYMDSDAKVLSQWDCFGFPPGREERTYTLVGGKEGGGFIIISDRGALENFDLYTQPPPFPTIVNSYSSTQWQGKGGHTSKKAVLTSLVDTNCVTDQIRPWNVIFECLVPGTQTSHPHAHSGEDEFVVVLAGKARYWCNGEEPEGLLEAGDCVGWKKGTGIAHSIINDAEGPQGEGATVVLLTFGESNSKDLLYYPTKADDKYFAGSDRSWKEHPKLPLGRAASIPRYPRGANAPYPVWEESSPMVTEECE
jgi:uncharacterized cupin superfamily protein